MEKNELVLAEQIVNDPTKAKDFMNNIKQNSSVIDKIAAKCDKFALLFDVVDAYLKGEYTYIPKPTIVGIVATILYVISPIDFIPDKIPGLGVVDDFTMVLVCLKLVENDIDRFLEWKKENNK